MKKANFILGITALSAMPALGQTASSRPNIIYILMDDLGFGDIGCYGQEKIETPHIDQLRQEGMRFAQHYTGSPVSAPARCVLMTGMHSGHAQIRYNNEMAYRGATNDHDSMFVHKELEGQYPLKANTMTIGRMMQNAGYTTGCFGKWGLGFPDSEGTPNKQGFNQFYGYNCQRQAHTYYPAFLYKNEERVYLKNKVINPHLARLGKDEDPYDPQNYKRFEQEEYANDLIFDELMSFVDENKQKPFFLMWTTPLPHVSLQAPERWVQHYVKKFGDEEPYTGKAGYGICRYPHATYAAMISYFDEQVGKLIQKLKAENLYDNTLIIFTSDNGPTFNGGQRLAVVQQRRLVQVRIWLGQMLPARRRHPRPGRHGVERQNQARFGNRPYLLFSRRHADTCRNNIRHLSAHRRHQFPAYPARQQSRTKGT